MRTIKIKIHPNNKQATKLKQTMNKCIEAQNIVFTMCKYLYIFSSTFYTSFFFYKGYNKDMQLSFIF